MKQKNKKAKQGPAAPPRAPQPAARHAFGFGWWLKSGVVAVVVVLLLPRMLRSNSGYEWLLDRYATVNLEYMKTYSGTTGDQRLLSKLGNDYSLILYLRQNTPTDAVLLYPERAWLTDSIGGRPSIFNGNLCDKLTAVRFLYPRRIVIPAEMGHTSWSRRLSHVTVVGQHGREYLSYPLPSDFEIGVMPVRPDTASSTASAPVDPQTPQP